MPVREIKTKGLEMEIKKEIQTKNCLDKLVTHFYLSEVHLKNIL